LLKKQAQYALAVGIAKQTQKTTLSSLSRWPKPNEASSSRLGAMVNATLLAAAVAAKAKIF